MTMLLSVWLQNNLLDLSIVNIEIINEFVSVDNNLITSCIPSDTDSAEKVLNQENNSHDNEVNEEEGSAEIVNSSYEDLLAEIRTVTRYLEMEGRTTNIILNNAVDITLHFLKSICFKESKRQTLFTDFFTN
ncbi:hypothetical protein QE152_g7318 [Popillia japonica]|uniref:Uncharacterized protein n=1 Tax=Popillia japonica TaxID=7064 RepID=A0AAW1MFS5_POPJA